MGGRLACSERALLEQGTDGVRAGGGGGRGKAKESGILKGPEPGRRQVLWPKTQRPNCLDSVLSHKKGVYSQTGSSKCQEREERQREKGEEREREE